MAVKTHGGRLAGLVLPALLLALAGCAATPPAGGPGASAATLAAPGRKPPSLPRLEAHADQMAARGQWMAAWFQYSRALALAGKKDIPRLKAKMAQAALAERQFVQAESLCRELIQLGYRVPAAWQGLGLARLGQGRLDQARQALEKAVSLEPRLWRAHNALGIILDRQQHPRQAASAFRRAIAIEPRRAALYNNLGLAYLLAGRLDQAESTLRQALRLDPDYKLAADNLALVLARRGRWQQARQSFTRALGEAAAHNNLGCLLSWAGDQARARREFEKALETSPRYYALAQRHLETVRRLAPRAPVELLPLPAPALPPLAASAHRSLAKQKRPPSPPSAAAAPRDDFGLIGVVSGKDGTRLVQGLKVGPRGLAPTGPGEARRLLAPGKGVSP